MHVSASTSVFFLKIPIFANVFLSFLYTVRCISDVASTYWMCYLGRVFCCMRKARFFFDINAGIRETSSGSFLVLIRKVVGSGQRSVREAVVAT
jgi:hypothetical protein